MSLRDVGVFNPLPSGHPLIGQACWKCDSVLQAGSRVALNPVETRDQTKSFTVEAKPICGTCHLKGKAFRFPVGQRIVQRIKEGDASPYPVLTTDGLQWRDDEIESSGSL